MNVFYQPLIANGATQLDEEESRHCIKVLRLREGDTIRVVDGNGGIYQVKITNADPKACTFFIESKTRTTPKPYRIHIGIAPTKNADRIEWFVEKTVEFGIDAITLLQCEHSERTFIKTERLRKVAVSAMKQSLKSYLPVIDGPVAFTSMLRSTKDAGRFIAHVDHSNPIHLKDAAIRGTSNLVLIGPEGDFSESELVAAAEHNFVKVSLGDSRLRTETAGIAACHVLNLINS